MNNRRNLFILAAVFVALAVITLLQDRQITQQAAPPTPAPTGTFQRIFPDMAVLDIQAIRLENPQTGDTFTISRADDGTWTAPGSEQTLDMEVATAIARTIVLLPYVESLPLIEDSELEMYGFQPGPRLFIQVLVSNGDAHIVAIGGLTPSQSAYYALVDEREMVYLLEAHAVAFLVTTLETPPLT